MSARSDGSLIGEYMVWRHQSGTYAPVIVQVTRTYPHSNYDYEVWDIQANHTRPVFARELTP